MAHSLLLEAALAVPGLCKLLPSFYSELQQSSGLTYPPDINPPAFLFGPMRGRGSIRPFKASHSGPSRPQSPVHHGG